MTVRVGLLRWMGVNLVGLVLVGTGWAGERSVSPDAVREVLGRTVPLLQKSAATYVEKRDCFSCHHQALPAITVARARRAGVSVDDDFTDEQSDFTLEYFSGRQGAGG